MRILLTVMLMVLPTIMLVLGKNFMRVRPKNKRSKIYYRTERSMRDDNTKRFAHQVCGKFYLWFGKWSMLFTCIIGIVFMRFPLQSFETACGVWLLCETLMLFAAVPLTERALAHRYGHDYI